MAHIIFSLAAVAVAGCTSAPPTAAELRRQDEQGLAQTSRVSKPAAGEPTNNQPGVVARIDSQPVTWSELDPLLAEASGGLILREFALDRALKAECEFKGIKVTDAEVAQERELLLSSIERDAAATPTDSGVLLESVRRSRGLGELRFNQLLARNARLRALVRSTVSVSEDDVEQALLIRYGERFRIRVIVTATQRDAIELRDELSKSPALNIAFSRAAAIKSIDASSVRGGLLEPISPADQLYPESIRKLFPALKSDAISPVVSVDKGFAMCILDSTVAATERPADAAQSASKEIRVRRERLAMEETARRLLARVEVAPLDPSLDWSWRALAPR